MAGIPQRIRAAWRAVQLNPLLAIGLAMTFATVAFAWLGPIVVDHNGAKVGAFLPRIRPSWEHLLGTDTQGRDLLTYLIMGTPKTLKIGLIAGTVGLGVGILLGLISGYSSVAVDTVIRTAADILMTIPGIAVLVLIAAYTRNITVEIMGLIVASLAWMLPTRTIRAQTLTLRERMYIEVARLNGVRGLELIIKEILPNLLPYIVASFVMSVSASILSSIGLESLGLGPQNDYTLGMMIYWAQKYGAVIRGMWWWWGPPIVVIVWIFVGLLLTSTGPDQLVNTRLRRVE